VAADIGFELRYPKGLKSADISAIFAPNIAGAAQQRPFAFELRFGEYAAAARISNIDDR